MTSFSYNTDNFPPLPSKEYSHQSTSAYIAVKSLERNSKVVSFSNTVNPLLFEKDMFVCTSKAYMFPLQSDDIFKSFSSSPVLSTKSFVYTTSGSCMHACLSPVPPIAVRNSKNIHNRSIRCNSVSSGSSNVDCISKPGYPFASSSASVISVSKSLKFTSTNSHSVDSSTFTFRVVNHGNIHRKRKLRKSAKGSSFANSTKSHDIANKLVVGRDKTNVLTEPF